jgi:hypothetical protein
MNEMASPGHFMWKISYPEPTWLEKVFFCKDATPAADLGGKPVIWWILPRGVFEVHIAEIVNFSLQNIKYQYQNLPRMTLTYSPENNQCP